MRLILETRPGRGDRHLRARDVSARLLVVPELVRTAGSGPAANVVAVLSVFGCVLLHELGHALMARRFGIETERHHALPDRRSGAVRRMPAGAGRRAVDRWRARRSISRSRRPSSLWSSLGGRRDRRLSLPGDFSTELLVVNLILGLFNLIPAFPMDGGRVLRALLSGWHGRVRRRPSPPAVGRILAVLFGLASASSWTGNPMHSLWPRSSTSPRRPRRLRCSDEERRAAERCAQPGHLDRSARIPLGRSGQRPLAACAPIGVRFA